MPRHARPDLVCGLKRLDYLAVVGRPHFFHPKVPADFSLNELLMGRALLPVGLDDVDAEFRSD